MGETDGRRRRAARARLKFVHWLLHGIDPEVHTVDEKLEEPDSVRRGMNTTLHSGYVGAAPPPGHGVHHYHFEVFAVDRPLDISDECTRDEIVEAMSGHVLAKGDVVATYAR